MLGRIAPILVRRRKTVIGLWILFFVASIAFGSGVVDKLETDAEGKHGTEAGRVLDELEALGQNQPDVVGLLDGRSPADPATVTAIPTGPPPPPKKKKTTKAHLLGIAADRVALRLEHRRRGPGIAAHRVGDPAHDRLPPRDLDRRRAQRRVRAGRLVAGARGRRRPATRRAGDRAAVVDAAPPPAALRLGRVDRALRALRLHRAVAGDRVVPPPGRDPQVELLHVRHAARPLPDRRGRGIAARPSAGARGCRTRRARS